MKTDEDKTAPDQEHCQHLLKSLKKSCKESKTPVPLSRVCPRYATS